MLKIELPIYWTQKYKTKKDKTVLVGMNWYRNAHYFSQNNMKKYFHEAVSKQLKEFCCNGKFTLSLDIYYKNPNCDGANIAALIEKFTLDALQEGDVVINDSVKHHLGSSWKIIKQDKNNPRCIITLTTVE